MKPSHFCQLWFLPHALLLVAICLGIASCGQDELEAETPHASLGTFTQLKQIKRYCRVHEFRLGFSLQRGVAETQSNPQSLDHWIHQIAPLGGEPTGQLSEVKGYSWYWSCLGCEEELPARDGAAPRFDAPTSGFAELRCRVHNQPISPVAGKFSDYNFSNPFVKASRLHFPNAGSRGFAEVTQPFDEFDSSWLSSCPKCEVECYEQTRYWFGPYR